MPSTSKAQYRKMEQLFKEGRISAQELENFNSGVSYSDLPEHVAPKVSSTTFNPLRRTRRPRRS
jgi:hypothetical protein